MTLNNCENRPMLAVGHQLFGLQGELLDLRVAVDPRLLEDLLEALASLDFPVNPQLFHRPGVVLVEFPAYRNHLAALQKHLKDFGFDPASIEVGGASRAMAAAQG